MALCASNLLIMALVLIIILHDIYTGRFNYLIDHSILGAILCFLFYSMCNYGLEQINWAFLALIPLYFFLTWLFTIDQSNTYHNADNYECGVCQTSISSCGCSGNSYPMQAPVPAPVPAPVQAPVPAPVQAPLQCKGKSLVQPSVNNIPELKCPAKPLKLATTCGISRYYE
jgi:hypothetical protein